MCRFGAIALRTIRSEQSARSNPLFIWHNCCFVIIYYPIIKIRAMEPSAFYIRATLLGAIRFFHKCLPPKEIRNTNPAISPICTGTRIIEKDGITTLHMNRPPHIFN